MSASVLPFIHAEGSWGEIGHQVGRMFAPSIARHLEAWTRHVMRLAQLLIDAKGPLTLADLQGFYRDHANAPHTLCAHPFPGRNLQTVVSVIGDLTNRELHVAKGAPCQAPYATYTLATCRTGTLSVTVRED